ncbi:MAG: hypothetical protein HKN00_13295 [Flavobacteriaceae bacterium]|nr:hypothetical protein [Bacteroidia bacterium]NNF76154.1 hypothetical protein [Flavobacteriaceae bacterium]NNK87984.1 hypothetical protein [Flavobacteriaceae bacterium]
METGNTSKYLKYAIGEILLVVIGILIALQINNWNESQKMERKEQILLTQLKQEFEDNLRQLNDKIAIRNRVIESSKFLLNMIDQKLNFHNDTIVFHLQRTLYTPTFNTNTNNFFVSKDINLLQNDSLKNLLSQWPTKVDELFEEEMVLREHRDNEYIPFLTRHIQVRDLYQQVELDLGMKDLIYPEGSDGLDSLIGRTNQRKKIDKLFLVEDIEDYLSFITLFSNIGNGQSVPLSKHIKLILDEINESIDNR